MSLLDDTAATLRLGTSDATDLKPRDLDGMLDEVTISQVVRYITDFTPPITPFVAD